VKASSRQLSFAGHTSLLRRGREQKPYLGTKFTPVFYVFVHRRARGRAHRHRRQSPWGQVPRSIGPKIKLGFQALSLFARGRSRTNCAVSLHLPRFLFFVLVVLKGASRGIDPGSKEYGKSQPLRALCSSLSRYRLNRVSTCTSCICGSREECDLGD